jgi:hypothetical protein
LKIIENKYKEEINVFKQQAAKHLEDYEKYLEYLKKA